MKKVEVGSEPFGTGVDTHTQPQSHMLLAHVVMLVPGVWGLNDMWPSHAVAFWDSSDKGLLFKTHITSIANRI